MTMWAADGRTWCIENQHSTLVPVGMDFLGQIGCHGEVSHFPGGIELLPQVLSHSTTYGV